MNWLQKIANWFQPTANAIDRWDWSPEVKAKLQEVWDNLPGSLQSSIWATIKKICDKYGEDMAQIILEKILNALGLIKR